MESLHNDVESFQAVGRLSDSIAGIACLQRLAGQLANEMRVFHEQHTAVHDAIVS